MDLLTPQIGLLVWGLVLLFILLLSTMAGISVLRNKQKSTLEKSVWLTVVYLVPVIGAVLYFVYGKRL